MGRLSAQMLEVGTNTRVRDVCDSVAGRLRLASWEGCSLFIKIADKVRGQGPQGKAGGGLPPALSQAPRCTQAVGTKVGGGVESRGERGLPSVAPGLSGWKWATRRLPRHHRTCRPPCFPLHPPRSSARRRETFSLTPCGRRLTGRRRASPRRKVRGGLSGAGWGGEGGVWLGCGGPAGLVCLLGQGQKAPWHLLRARSFIHSFIPLRVPWVVGPARW